MTNEGSELTNGRVTQIGVAAMLSATVIWMVIPILVKVALRVFDPISISAFRLPVAAVLLSTLHMARGGHLRDLMPRTGWHLIGGLALGMNYYLYSLGLSLTTAGAGTVIIQVQIVTLVILARLVLGERLSAIKLVAIGGVIAGSGIVLATPGVMGELTEPSYRTGNLVMLVAGICFGSYALASRALATRRGARYVPALEIAVPILIIASLINFLALPFSRLPTSVSVDAVVALALLGIIGTGANYALMTFAFRRLSAATAGTITAFTPLGVVVLAALTLGEPVPLPIIAAAAIVTAGVLALMLDERAISGARPEGSPAMHSRQPDQPRPMSRK